MPPTSDISIDTTKFDPVNASDATKEANALLEDITIKGPRWWEVGIQKYRQMGDQGQTPLPKLVYLTEALDATVPSRETGRDIPVRVYKPDIGQPSKGILLHVRGGGFVLAAHKDSDGLLQCYANQCRLTAISVGYRLAPENVYPAAAHDCADAAEYSRQWHCGVWRAAALYHG